MAQNMAVLSAVKWLLEQHRWFCRESHGYIGPYTWRRRLEWPRAWCRFMWFTVKHEWLMRNARPRANP